MPSVRRVSRNDKHNDEAPAGSPKKEQRRLSTVDSALEVLGLKSRPMEYYNVDTATLHQSAETIQRFWRAVRGFWNISLRRKIMAATHRKIKVTDKIREIIKYSIFLMFFTTATIGDFIDQDNFHFQNNVRGQFAEVNWCLVE
jgi:hypothetical protein